METEFRKLKSRLEYIFDKYFAADIREHDAEYDKQNPPDQPDEINVRGATIASGLDNSGSTGTAPGP